MNHTRPALVAITASEAPERPRPPNYPALLAEKFKGRRKHPLGDLFGLSNFGVNLTVIAPGSASSFRHAHRLQDEFIYVVSGHPTLLTNAGPTELQPGMCAGFKAGNGDAHCLVNHTNDVVVILEVGDRRSGDAVEYPDDDLQAVQVDGTWRFSKKNGDPL